MSLYGPLPSSPITWPTEGYTGHSSFWWIFKPSLPTVYRLRDLIFLPLILSLGSPRLRSTWTRHVITFSHSGGRDRDDRTLPLGVGETERTLYEVNSCQPYLSRTVTVCHFFQNFKIKYRVIPHSLFMSMFCTIYNVHVRYFSCFYNRNSTLSNNFKSRHGYFHD